MPDQSLRQLENQGLLALNETRAPADATLVVVGVARGGTSLAAGVLDALGVFLGDDSHPPVYEDLRLSRAFEDEDTDRIAAVVTDYNARHRHWGWKRPSAVHYLDQAHSRLRHPRYLVVFKDIFSIANRNRISMANDILPGMGRALDEYQKVLDFLQRHQPPALLISYDKALRDKQGFVDAAIEFCGLTPTPSARERALAFITPSPEAYMEATRADRVVGHLDVADPHQVAGWAALAVAGTRNQKPLPVELWINDVHTLSTIANEYRADLKQARVHPSGKAGFVFRLPDDAQLQAGDRVRVFAGIERTELANSPRTLSVAPPVVAQTSARRSDNPLVFLHIPKTAGTSLRALLSKQIPDQAMVILDPPLAAGTKAEFTQRLPQMRALMGHLYFGVDEQLGFRADYVTFLRDPVARVVSFWKHQQTHAHSAFHAQVKAGVTLREFVNSCQTLQTDNHMTRILVGTCAPGMLDGSINRIADERYLQIALDNVAQRFRFVGFVEHFDASIRALFEALGWPVKAKWDKRLNVLRSARDELDDATLEAIRRHNALDLALYQQLLDSAPWISAMASSEGAL